MMTVAIVAFYVTSVTVSTLFMMRSRNIATARERFLAMDAMSPTTAAEAVEAVEMGLSEADLRTCRTSGVIQTDASQRYYWDEDAYRAYRLRLTAIHVLSAVAMVWLGALVIVAAG
jgi:hypothetical protein